MAPGKKKCWENWVCSRWLTLWQSWPESCLTLRHITYKLSQYFFSRFFSSKKKDGRKLFSLYSMKVRERNDTPLPSDRFIRIWKKNGSITNYISYFFSLTKKTKKTFQHNKSILKWRTRGRFLKLVTNLKQIFSYEL